MAIVPDGYQIALQGTGDTDPVIDGKTLLKSTTFTVGSKSIDTYWQLRKNISGTFYYYGYNLAGGTMYGGANFFSNTTPGAIGSTGASAHGATSNQQTHINKFGTGSSATPNRGITASTGGMMVDHSDGRKPLTYGTPYYNYLVTSQPGMTTGIGINLPNSTAIGNISNLTFESTTGRYWKVEQLLWLKNTRTSGSYYNESSDVANGYLTKAIFNGSNITNDNNSNWLFMLISEQQNSNYNSILASSGYSIPSTSEDQYFGSIEVNGVELKTRDAGYHNALTTNNGVTTYTYTAFGWPVTDSQINTLGQSTSGTKTFKVYSRAMTSHAHSGIAEEFGAADSADVRLGDYYGGGGIIDESAEHTGGSKGQLGIPYSGEIKMSDFYEASKVTRKTLTNGKFVSSFCVKSCSYTYYYGYDLALGGGIGSLSTGYGAPTFDNKIIRRMYWTDGFGGSLTFEVQGKWPADMFDALYIKNGTGEPESRNYDTRFLTHNAAHQVYDQRIPPAGGTVLTYTRWTWGGILNGISNPFDSTEGSTHNILIVATRSEPY